MRFGDTALGIGLGLLVSASCAHAPPPAASAPAPEEPADKPLSPEEMQRVQDEVASPSRVEAVNRCYADELTRRRDRSFTGTVTVNIVIERDGSVSSADVVESTLKAPDIERCITDAIEKWSLDPITGHYQYTYTFSFQPQY